MINPILHQENLDMDTSFSELANALKKNLRSFFKQEVLPAIESRQLIHVNFERKKSTVSVAVTPLSSGITLISLDETFHPDKQNYRSVPERIKDILIRVNSDLVVIYLSKNFRAVSKLQKNEVAGKTIEECNLFGDQTDAVVSLVSNCFSQQKQQHTDLPVPGKKNTWFDLSMVPETDPVSGDQSVLLVLKNISRFKEIENKLTQSEQRYEMAVEATDLGIWDYDVTSGKTFYSRKWKSMLGYYPDEIPDEYSVWEDLLHPEDKERMIRFMSQFLKSNLRLYEAEFRMRHKNGHYIWVRSRATVQRDQNDKPLRMLGTHRDITEEKKSESEFTKLHQAILQSPISVIITDKDGYIEFFNPAFCKITGWNDQEIIGKKTNILKSGFHPQSFYAKLWKTITAGNEWQGELKNKKKNGEFYWELASISPIRNSFGTITHFVKISENISYLKKIENDLKKAKQEAEIANNYKNHFLANMSHEIRTPINTIIGFSELIKNERLQSEKRNKYSEIIEENSQALLRLIDDIIDVAKIEANELKIKKEACSLDDMFSELEITYSNFLKRKQKQGLELVVHIPEESHHDVIFTDPYRLKQILNNLFLNALKHTDSGKIEIGYSILNENKLRFFVSDTGSGIPSNRLKSIFKRFQHADDNTTDIHGSGIGLSISKDLANLLGGDITVKSVLNEGSTFYLTLPYDKIKIPLVRTSLSQQAGSAGSGTGPGPSIKSSGGSQTQARYNFSNYTIMIAEDTPYNYEYLYSILQKTGANILWAKDGIDVLKMYNSTKIDLILMDIQLPEINGYEATEQIRKSNQAIPIIAQTAYAMADDKKKCLDSGCNEVLVKPIRMDEVLITLARYLNK
jgi:two-component system sensor histidine kinase/response regulator